MNASAQPANAAPAVVNPIHVVSGAAKPNTHTSTPAVGAAEYALSLFDLQGNVHASLFDMARGECVVAEVRRPIGVRSLVGGR